MVCLQMFNQSTLQFNVKHEPALFCKAVELSATFWMKTAWLPNLSAVTFWNRSEEIGIGFKKAVKQNKKSKYKTIDTQLRVGYVSDICTVLCTCGRLLKFVIEILNNFAFSLASLKTKVSVICCNLIFCRIHTVYLIFCRTCEVPCILRVRCLCPHAPLARFYPVWEPLK